MAILMDWERRLRLVTDDVLRDYPWLARCVLSVWEGSNVINDTVVWRCTLELPGEKRQEIHMATWVDTSFGNHERMDPLELATATISRLSADAFARARMSCETSVWYPIAMKSHPRLMCTMENLRALRPIDVRPVTDEDAALIVEHMMLSEDQVLNDVGAWILQRGMWPDEDSLDWNKVVRSSSTQVSYI